MCSNDSKEELEICSYWLKSAVMEIEILNLGATIRRWRVLNGETWQDICLGYENIEDYRDNSAYFGAVVGRVAGRIANGSFILNGEKYTLNCNGGVHHLHGGVTGFSYRIWNCEKTKPQRLVFTYHSPDGEEGYPGNLDVEVSYQLLDERTLMVNYAGQSDADTLCDLTQHAYFNLSKDWASDVLAHELEIPSNDYALLDEHGMVNGHLERQEGTPFDFTQPCEIRSILDEKNPQIKYANGGYDHPFRLAGSEPIYLAHRASRLAINIRTDMPYVILYTGNYLEEGKDLLNGKKCAKHLGLCLETQHIPNAVNMPNFTQPRLLAGQQWTSSTTYQVQFL